MLTHNITLKKVTTLDGKTHYVGTLPEGLAKGKQKLQIKAYDEQNLDEGLRSMVDKSPSKDGSFYLLIEAPTR